MNLGASSQAAPYAIITVDGVPTDLAVYANEEGGYVEELVIEDGLAVFHWNGQAPVIKRRSGRVRISFPPDSPFQRLGDRVRAVGQPELAAS